ncbi:hypothetical protein NDK43_00155 [Neobacillus pocheonensis]|uniref:Uncharacterized protein n=1 Tax=Neobacillus pocheonensis TaxID=363869 RepID=A0ABT0W468_9BACI|nr:hypothetical protein [Neobacillus pocheonensis]
MIKNFQKGCQIGEVFLEAFKKEKPDVEIVPMHLYDMEIPEIDMDLLYARAKLSFMGYSFEQLSEAERTKITKMHALADKFINGSASFLIKMRLGR